MSAMTREQRQRRLGIDCPDHLVWKNWEVGKEYTRRLIIKNVEGRAQTISYSLPERKVTFLTPYPEPVTLSSGVSFELEVRFCPTEVEEIHDLMEITVKGRGSFIVYLESLTPFAQLDVPATHDFQFCAVHSTSSATVPVKNTGTVPLDFYWELAPPFRVSPARGVLRQGESMQLTVYFEPTEAYTVIGEAVCKMVGLAETIASMRLSGVGKYPYIRLLPRSGVVDDGMSSVITSRADEEKKGVLSAPYPLRPGSASLDFGDTRADAVETREFYIENPSPVAASVQLRRSDDAMECPFSLHPTTCTIPRGGRQLFRATYKAQTSGSLHRNQFEICARAGNTIRLELKGRVVGPSVKASTTYLNFGDVNLERLPSERDLTRYIQLKNASTGVAHFFIPGVSNGSGGAAFGVEPCTGTIPARGSCKIKVCFQPISAMNYLRQLLIVIHHAADALAVHVFGSAYNSLTRPLPFALPEVEAFYARLRRGMGLLTPEQLERLALNATLDGTNTLDAFPAPVVAHNVHETHHDAAQLTPPRRLGHVGLRVLAGFDAAARDETASAVAATLPFVLESNTLSFGRQQPVTQTVVVRNRTAAVALAVWCVAATCPYYVSPEQQDVSPGGAAQFQVGLRATETAGLVPSGGATYSVGGITCGATFLECYVNFKEMRSFRLVKEHAFTPPHCLLLQCRQQRTETMTPAAVVAGARAGNNTLVAVDTLICLPASRVYGSSFQILALTNLSDAVALYELTAVTLRNVVAKTTHDVAEVRVAADGTVVSMTTADQMHCPTAAPGLAVTTVAGVSTNSNALTDASTTTLPFDATHHLTPRSADAIRESGALMDNVFTCYPARGVLQPQQRVLVVVQFSPTRHARYEAEATFVFSTTTTQVSVVRLQGESCIPSLVIENVSHNTLVFHPTCLAGETWRSVQLLNPTNLHIHYQLVPDNSLRSVLSVEPRSGVLAPGARKSVRATFRPFRPGLHCGSVNLVLHDVAEEDDGEDGSVALSAITPPQTAMAIMGATAPTGIEETTARQYVMALAVRAEAIHGIVELEPTSLDLGEVAGQQPQTVALTLFNSSACEVAYEMRVLTTAEPAEWRHCACPPRIHRPRGTLAARIHAEVLVTVQPLVGESEYVFYVMLRGHRPACAGLTEDEEGSEAYNAADPCTAQEALQYPHCVLRVRGTRPAIQITDARSMTRSRTQLWRQLAINAINAQLAAAVRPRDVESSSFTFAQYIRGLEPIVLNLGVGHVQMRPMRVTLLLENAGDCPATFRLWLPTESDASQEHWFLEDAELKGVQDIVDRGVLQVTPREGVIDVGGSTTITMSYHFDSVGDHTLPLLLRVGDGKKVLLVLQGRTLPASVACITLQHAAEYHFMPVAVGDVQPPMQSVDIENLLDRAVSYTVDLAALSAIADQNFGFPVLQCVNPTGTLAAHTVGQLWWYFRPLEARTYTMMVPLQMQDGESYELHFTGSGYHPAQCTVTEQRTQLEHAFLSIPHGPPSAPTQLRPYQARQALLPSVPVLLSHDVLSFGSIPYFSLHRRLCTVYNEHPSHTYSFAWETAQEYADHVVTVLPSEGVLRPGEKVTCRVLLYAGSGSQLMECSVWCRIRNETLLDREVALLERDLDSRNGQIESVSRATQSWERAVGGDSGDGDKAGQEKEEKEEMTTVKDGGTMTGRVPCFANAVASTKGVLRCSACPRLKDVTALQPASSYGGGGDDVLGGRTRARQPVTTVPLKSLGVNALAARVDAVRRQERDGGVLLLATQSSEDGLAGGVCVTHAMELLLQARIMPVQDYESLYGKDSTRGFFLPVMSIVPELDTGTVSTTPLSVSVEEACLIRDVLGELLHYVIAMPQVQAAFTEPFVRNEEVYYRNLTLTSGHTTFSRRPHYTHANTQHIVSNIVEELLETVVFNAVTSLTV